MVPAALADSGKGGLAKPHLELVGQDDGDDQVFAVPCGALTASDGGRDDVGGVARVLLPVDIVVVHDSDHQGVGQRSRNDVCLFAAPENGRRPFAAGLLQHLEGDQRVFLAVAAEGAAERVEQIASGLVDGLFADVFKLQIRGPAGHRSGNGVRHLELSVAVFKQSRSEGTFRLSEARSRKPLRHSV